MTDLEELSQAMSESLGSALARFEDTPENRLALASLHMQRALDLYRDVLGVDATRVHIADALADLK